MGEKKIKLNEQEIEIKKDQIEELEVTIAGSTIRVESLKKEIEQDLIMRQTKSQLKKLIQSIESYKKNKEILEKQLKDWK